MHATIAEPTGLERATESIVVRIRWFGVVMGYVLVQARVDQLRDPSAVRAFLALGAGFAALDTAFHHMGEVFLERRPLFVSAMESIFIALLCYHDTGLDSPFRWYYLLSLVCCAIRYRPTVAWLSLTFHGLSLLVVSRVVGPGRSGIADLPLTMMILAWTTWATSSLAGLLRTAGARLERANADLKRHRDGLERRVAERTEALRTAQARVIHQEKMAAFGLLAAGIAHEVGNPLAALSSLVQMLQRRGPDPYTSDKLDLAGRQLERIRRTVRDLIEFSRPASTTLARVRLAEVVDDVLAIAKYATRPVGRSLTTDVPEGLPPVVAPRDHLVQVVLNLVLNAVDATGRGGHIHLEARAEAEFVTLRVTDDGRGIPPEDRSLLFQPYFTTKPKGTGLGLYVSRQIVEELGGTIMLESGTGPGTTFALCLPSVARAEPAPTSAVEEVAR